MDLLQTMRAHDLEEVVAIYDPATGLLGYVVIHDTTRGPGIGGIRLVPYPDEATALDDGVRLAEAMSRKCALAGLNAGGAKGVFIDHPGITDRPAMLRALGRYVESLAGRFYTSGDLGMTPADLAHVGETTRYVAVPDDQKLDLAGATADGVVEAMRAALRAAGRASDLGGVRVAVQGLGAMGGRVARSLAGAGAVVFASDIAPARCAAFAAAENVTLVDPATIYDLDVDVFSPCAVGGVLHPGTIDRLRCAVVVGAANNQLADAAADAALHARGIRYAPDYAVNAGAVALGAAYFLDMAFDPIETVQRAVERIGETVRRIFDESDAAGEPPGAVADRLAAEALVRPRSTERQWWPVA